MSKKKAANWKSTTTNGFFAVYIVPMSIGITLIPVGIETIQIEITLFPIGIKAILIEKGLMSIGIGAIPVDIEPISTGIKTIPIGNGLIPIGIRAIPVYIRPFPAYSGAGTTVVFQNKSTVEHISAAARQKKQEHRKGEHSFGIAGC